jgi:hypothetical protein
MARNVLVPRSSARASAALSRARIRRESSRRDLCPWSNDQFGPARGTLGDGHVRGASPTSKRRARIGMCVCDIYSTGLEGFGGFGDGNPDSDDGQ